jgi:hypothetical protein
MFRLVIGALCVVLAGLTQSSAPVPLTDDSTVFVDTSPASTTALYHRQGCAWLTRGSPTAFKVRDVKARYFQPHCLCVSGADSLPPCSPPAASSNVPLPAANAAPAPISTPTAATETVYVTKTGAKYHRAGCQYLANSSIAVALSLAVEHYSPCSVCRPPASGASTGATLAGAIETPRAAPVASAPSSRQCAATTKKGTRCSRTAKAGSSYCWQHGG